MTAEHSFDVVVVGCGIAGLSAAVTAHQAGARVAVLERAPREDRGGNSRWTEAYLRMKSESEVADDFEAHFGANAGHNLDPSLLKAVAGAYEDRPGIVKALGFTDPELIGAFAEGAGPALAWLKGFGVKFDFLPNFFITTCTTRMAPVGGGLAMVEALATWAEQNGVPIFYETAAKELILSPDGAVTGLRARDGDGNPLRFVARSVVLACGGFEGNPEMQARYFGGQARYIRPVARGGYYNKGDGHRMALALGAAPSGDWTLFHAEPIDPRSGQPEPVVMVFNYGILVNRDGARFTDEAPATVDATYEAITRQIFAQAGGLAWVILDGRIDEVPNWRKAIRSDQPAIEAATLAELAARIDIDGDSLAATIDAYNAACPSRGAFNPLAADGLATSGLVPRKSNWARPLDRPPFRAWPIACANCFTFGGVKVDVHARVLDGDGLPIPGLYAGGELIGLYYGTYTGATSVLRGAVFGRAAGSHAARRAKENLR
jgi:tricarballylate dehydrogenase